MRACRWAVAGSILRQSITEFSQCQPCVGTEARCRYYAVNWFLSSIPQRHTSRQGTVSIWRQSFFFRYRHFHYKHIINCIYYKHYLYNGTAYTGTMASLYWDEPLLLSSYVRVRSVVSFMSSNLSDTLFSVSLSFCILRNVCLSNALLNTFWTRYQRMIFILTLWVNENIRC